VDFSDCSLAGLKFAVRFAKEVGARIIVLHVADLGPVMMTTACGDFDSSTYTEAARRRCGKQMLAFLKRVDFDGVPVHTSSVAGYCPAAICQAAAKERADLIILSTHGRTGLRRAFLGSVAEGTVRAAACPVLVVFVCVYAQKVCGQKRAPASDANAPTKSAQVCLSQKASELIGAALLARLLDCGRATRVCQSRAQKMRGNSQLLQSRNLICPEE
jgi:nucleotide-binding universal stress UspA family protein